MPKSISNAEFDTPMKYAGLGASLPFVLVHKALGPGKILF